MSRHIVDSTLRNHPVRITVGYDCGRSEYFLHIGWLNEKAAVVVHTSVLALVCEAESLQTIRAFMERLKVDVPRSVWTEVAHDAATKNGHRVVRHLSDGTMQELLIH